MKIKCWGSRGSLPASYFGQRDSYKIREVLLKAIESNLTDPSQLDGFIEELPFHLKSGYGTNTSCVEIIGGDEIIICDAGSGIRDLGNHLISLMPNMPKVINILMSHLHWDHIQGFPFFIPAYLQGVTINIWGCHRTIEQTFIQQQEPPTFPVALKDMGSQINFLTLDVDQPFELGGIKICMIEQPHPGTSYGYRFEKDGKIAVYSTDAEHTEDSESKNYPFLRFFKDADVLIFDGQFSLADHLYTKQNWGHSSNLVGIELAVRAGVKKLCLFHSEPNFNDQDLSKFLSDSKRYLKIYDDQANLDVAICYDGMVIEL